MRWGVLILLGIFFVSFASAVVPGDCESSLISYWQFEGDVLDGNNNDYDGARSGDDDYGSLVVGEAALFNGGNSVSVSDNNDMFNGAFGVEMWISKNDMAPLADATLIEMGDYEINFTVGNRVLATVGSVSISSGALTPGSKYHVALVNSSGTLRLYINGGEVDSAALSGSPSTGSSGLIIGSGFVGLIDELAIYDESLNSGVIGSHYALSNAGSDYCAGVASGSTGTSETQTTYTLGGCVFDVGDGDIGVKKGECSGGVYAGKFFCSNEGEPFITEGEDGGCEMGDSEYKTVNGKDFCCPSTKFCNSTLAEAGTGNFKCDTLTVNCEDLDEGDCNNAGCRWIDPPGECVHDLWDKACGYYDRGAGTNTASKAACLGDVYDIGKKGVGTELCGTTFVCNNGVDFSVPEDSCSCGWYSELPEGDRCRLDMIATEMFNTTPFKDIFNCSNSFDLGDCDNGEQTVTWFSNSSVVSGFDGASLVPVDCLEALNCNGGDTTRFCGEALIRLPGFSLFALFLSLFIIGMYYIKKS